MADFRTILLKLRIQPAPITTPVLPVAFPTLAFTFTTERKKKYPKLATYHGNKKEFQPWYFQIRTKFQVDFTHFMGTGPIFLHP